MVPPILPTDNPNLATLMTSVAAICQSNGFSSINQTTLNFLTDLLKNYMEDTAKLSKTLAEHSGRTNAVPSDITLALIQKGFPLSGIREEVIDGLTQPRPVIHPPKSYVGPSASKLMKIGEHDKPRYSSHYPEWLPPFPDPHTFVRTRVHEDRELTYAEVREGAAKVQNDVEKSLLNYLIKINPSIPLFPNVAECSIGVLKPQQESLPWLSALSSYRDSSSSAGAGKGGSGGGGKGGDEDGEGGRADDGLVGGEGDDGDDGEEGGNGAGGGHEGNPFLRQPTLPPSVSEASYSAGPSSSFNNNPQSSSNATVNFLDPDQF